MSARALPAVLFAALLATANVTLAGEFDLDSREYKLMLDPAKFPVQEPGKTVDEFWEQQLKRIIADALDKRENDEARHKGSFNDTKERLTVFRDTDDCALTKVGYVLRDRTKIKKGKLEDREATLKFRTPDVVVAWAAYPGDDEAKFEEDIAPLLLRKVDASGNDIGAAFAHPPSMRSIFSVSIERDLEPTDKLDTLADAASHYDDLESRLAQAGAKQIDLGAKLQKGETFHEVVYQGARVDLGHEHDAEIDLSLWYRAATFGTEGPELAELSFKYDVEDSGAMGGVARRALVLFKALQMHLGDWASPERETKTAAALPGKCADGG